MAYTFNIFTGTFDYYRTTGSGGSALASESPSSGSGTIYTFAHTPLFQIIDNQTFYNGVGYDLSGNTATYTNAPTTIQSFYSASNTVSSETATSGSGTVYIFAHLPVFQIVDNQPMYNGVGYDITGSGPYTLTYSNAPTTIQSFYNT